MPIYPDDEDVPFRLPLAEDYTLSDDETEELKLPRTTTQPDVYSQPTQPLAESTVKQSVQLPRIAPPPPTYARSQPSIPPPLPNMPPSRPVPPTKKRAPSRTWMNAWGCLPSGCLMALIGLLVTFCGGLSLVTLGALLVANNRITPILEERLETVQTYQAFESTFYYDRHGELLYEDFNEGRRVKVALAQIPQSLIDATIALEDDNFYTNPGIDFGATLRATLQFTGVLEGNTGGSTITQQLVRNIAFDYAYRTERSVQRKVEEILLAFALTQRLSKDAILELYLNEIYYGNLAYGAQAAAQTVFGKDVGDLTIGESALLAGLPQAPSELDPLSADPQVQQAVELRWRTVLDAMVREGYLTDEQRAQTLREGIQFYTPDTPLRAPHFTVYAQSELDELLLGIGIPPQEVALGGLSVYTTVDLQINNMAQDAIANQVNQLRANNVSNGAVVVLKPLTGEILAMVGSADYQNDAIDGRVNVATALRQPGSTIKAFTYAAAVENGFSPAEVIWDTPMRSIPVPGQSTWPLNYDNAYHGAVNMRQALANSYNVPAVKVLQQAVGTEGLLNFLNRFGFVSLGTDPSLYGASLTLGGGEVTLLELTSGYSVFANHGARVQPTAILCVVKSDGTLLYQYETTCPDGNVSPQTVARNGLGVQVLDPRIAFLIGDILADNNARTPAMGSNSPLRTDGIYSSVKTGTTNNLKDNWTVGFTHNVAVGVWVGNSNGDPMVNSTGLTGAAPIWNNVITRIYTTPTYFESLTVGGTHQPDQATPPDGIALQTVCDVSRLTDGQGACSATVAEWLLTTPPTKPDENGNLVYQQLPNLPNEPRDDQPFVQEVSPGVVMVRVHSIPSQIAAGIQFSNLPPNVPTPPPPLYCQVPFGLLNVAAQMADQVFLKPPIHPADAVEAELYARAQGLAYLPTIACSADLLNANVSAQSLTAIIQQPTNGQAISQGIPIIGTVQFTPDQAQFYKLEIIGGQFGEWTTIGNTHTESVVNGQLEFLPGYPGLQAGTYQLRLVLVGYDGQYVQEPFVVGFSITP